MLATRWRGPYTAGDLAGDTRLVDAVTVPDKVQLRELPEQPASLFAPLGKPQCAPGRAQHPGETSQMIRGHISEIDCPFPWDLILMRQLTFIVGTGRSGSTALSRIVRTHTGILSLNEFLTSLVAPDIAFIRI